MNTYLSAEAADLVIENGSALTYPNYRRNLQQFPAIDGKVGLPSPLLVESMHLIGNEPKTVLEIGSASCLNGLYLAAHGHKVTAIDTDRESLEWAREKAREIGIPDVNFTPKVLDARCLASTERYQVLLSQMLLHCLSISEACKVLQNTQSITEDSGLNILSAYTIDNPKEEIEIRGLKCMFQPDDLAAGYGEGWKMHRIAEGMAPEKLPRKGLVSEDDLYLVPTIMEIIAQKSTRILGAAALRASVVCA